MALPDALRAAMRAGNLDEANAIRAMGAKVVAGEPVAVAAGKVAARKPISVTRAVSHPKEGWKAVMQVRKGDTLEFEVVGEWIIFPMSREQFVGPDGASGGRGALMAKINEFPYRVGSKKTIEVPEDGVLYLGTNEPNPSNKGEMVATIRTFRGGSK